MTKNGVPSSVTRTEMELVPGAAAFVVVQANAPVVEMLAPTGALVATCLGVLALGSHGVTWFQGVYLPYALIAPCFLAALVGYYLVWKYIVGFLNRVVGIA